MVENKYFWLNQTINHLSKRAFPTSPVRSYEDLSSNVVQKIKFKIFLMLIQLVLEDHGSKRRNLLHGCVISKIEGKRPTYIQ